MMQVNLQVIPHFTFNKNTSTLQTLNFVSSNIAASNVVTSVINSIDITNTGNIISNNIRGNLLSTTTLSASHWKYERFRKR